MDSLMASGFDQASNENRSESRLQLRHTIRLNLVVDDVEHGQIIDRISKF